MFSKHATSFIQLLLEDTLYLIRPQPVMASTVSNTGYKVSVAQSKCGVAVKGIALDIIL